MTKNLNQRAKDLLYLETCIINAIHEEIERNMRTGRQGDIKERIRYIIDEQRIEELGGYDNL